MLCAVCQKEADKICSACKSVAYCSIDHQRSHFKIHKKSCSSFTILDISESQTENLVGQVAGGDPLGQKYALATRDLKQGSIIHEEDPIFSSAESNTSEEFCVQNQLLNCSTCGLNMASVSMAVKCENCGWPVCGESDCHSHPLHAENECQIFSKHKILMSNYILPDLIKVINLMRVWRMTRHQNLMDTTKWTDLMVLFDDVTNENEDTSTSPDHSYQEILWPARLTLDKFPCFKSLEEFDQILDNYKKIRFLSKLKGFYVQAEELMVDPDSRIKMKPLHRTSSYLFKKASHLRHSCSPNVTWSVSSYPDFKLRLRAMCPIKKGSILTVSHLWRDWDLRDGTIRRQEAHFKRFGFHCHCGRCLDPTEFRSYASALRCSTCHGGGGGGGGGDLGENEGFFLPENPIQSGKQNAPWICNKCQKVVEYSQFSGQIAEYLENHKRETNKLQMAWQTNYEVLGFFKRVMDQLMDFVHPNHWLIQWGARVIVTKISCGSTQAETNQYLRLIKYLLAIEDLIIPAMSSFRALLLRNVGIAVKGRVEAIPNVVMSGGAGFANNLSRLKETMELLQFADDCVEKSQTFWLKEFPPRNGAFTSYAKCLQEELRIIKSDLKNTNKAIQKLMAMKPQ